MLKDLPKSLSDKYYLLDEQQLKIFNWYIAKKGRIAAEAYLKEVKVIPRNPKQEEPPLGQGQFKYQIDIETLPAFFNHRTLIDRFQNNNESISYTTARRIAMNFVKEGLAVRRHFVEKQGYLYERTTISDS